MNVGRIRLGRIAFGAVVGLAAVGAGCSTSKVAVAESASADSGEKAPALAALVARSRAVTAPEGTSLKIRTTSTVSTKANHAGETFRASLEEPLVIDGAVVAPRGADVTVMIADANKGGRVKGRARIGLRVVGLRASDGESRNIRTNTIWHEARGTKKKDAAKVGIGSGIGAAIGAIAGGGAGAAIGAGAGAGAGGALVLGTRGAPAVIPAETVLQFRLAQPLTVEVRS